MKKEEYIKRYGGKAWEKKLQQGREYHATHRDEEKANFKAWYEMHQAEDNAQSKVWRETHLEEVKAHHRGQHRKGGKHYEKRQAHKMQGIPHAKNLIRGTHQRIWTPFKQIIAPKSQIHHEWILGTAEYRGVAIVEADSHMHGFIDVIHILEGELTLFTEAEIRMGDMN